MTDGRAAGGKRATLLDAACAIVADRGAEATRLADVTAATGAGTSTLQYYFGSREDLLLAVFQHAARKDFEAAVAVAAGIADPWHRLVTIAQHLTRAGADDTPWRVSVESWRWALRDPELRDEVLADRARWRTLIATTIEAGLDCGAFTTTAPPEAVARQTQALIDGLTLPRALGDPPVDAPTPPEDAPPAAAASHPPLAAGWGSRRSCDRSHPAASSDTPHAAATSHPPLAAASSEAPHAAASSAARHPADHPPIHGSLADGLLTDALRKLVGYG
ncbi:hypothetical protein Ade02nite_52970 [Paractinoplanes deccanensis]|uniref:HTH tetR-type domain-containing protein n=1 Tax=Paractinoplanes deccanensis TaxID=113561 RepID=A0ABQ3Y9H5_9ACTN|nr:TetR/AcrR family transcriptional regulator [Actinoplanes deccanensis]GID76656.1 hypothetical protein Ade02nite_52970 [Actinoplanes deccanensis]